MKQKKTQRIESQTVFECGRKTHIEYVCMCGLLRLPCILCDGIVRVVLSEGRAERDDRANGRRRRRRRCFSAGLINDSRASCESRQCRTAARLARGSFA